MTVVVHSNHKWVTLSTVGSEDLVHEVPRKTKFFKEELRSYRAEISAWLCGRDIDVLEVYIPEHWSFYRRWLYNAIVYTTRRKDGLVLIKVYKESSHVIR